MKNTGDGRRKVRVEKEVQEIISRFIISQLRHDLPGVVTVTRITMPADFRAAQVYVTYFSPAAEAGEKMIDVAEILQSWSKDIQDEIAHTLKMRYCPKITFYNDEATEKILKIERLLDNLSKNPAAIDPDEDFD